MPTARRRHAITETPPVQEALDALRGVTGNDRVDLGELVVLGAREKLARIRAEADRPQRASDELAEWVLTGTVPGDPHAADAARSSWVRDR